MPTENDYGYQLNAGKLNDYNTNWARCLDEDLPDLFTVFDKEDDRVERLASFRFRGGVIQEIVDAADAFGSNYRLYIRLALMQGYQGNDDVPEEPYFYPALEVIKADANKLTGEYGFMPAWNPNPPIIPSTTESGVDEIPGAGAYLFVEQWLSTPHQELGDCFQLTAAHLDSRVRAYMFSTDESKLIIDSLRQPTNKADFHAGQLSIHLGSSFVVDSHPVAFRPVVEMVTAPDGSGHFILAQKSNKYYDFQAPIPPNSVGG